jgi:hypothetical protein
MKMNVFCSLVGRFGTTRYIYELMELATRYRDRVIGAVRIEFQESEEENHFVYSYGLVIKPVTEGIPYWVPYCSRNTTNFSGEGGSGHRKIEEHLEKLGIFVYPLTVKTAPEDENDEPFLTRAAEALLKQ